MCILSLSRRPAMLSVPVVVLYAFAFGLSVSAAERSFTHSYTHQISSSKVYVLKIHQAE